MSMCICVRVTHARFTRENGSTGPTGPAPWIIKRGCMELLYVKMSYSYWFGTGNEANFTPMGPLPIGVAYIRGQKEQGIVFNLGASGYVHWQLLIVLSRKQRLSWLSARFPNIHWEPSRSTAADAYVWKDETSIDGTRFEIGTKPFRRNSKTDWGLVRQCAQSGKLESVPDDVFVRYYGSLKRIAQDCCQPAFVDRTCTVFWGPTGVGKSHRAWEAAGVSAYAKDPLTKWWCGYQGQAHVIIDEFRGVLSISHLLRWLDRYPVLVETKGSAFPLCATHFWITSNLPPESWYPELDAETYGALMRRLNVVHITERQ